MFIKCIDFKVIIMIDLFIFFNYSDPCIMPVKFIKTEKKIKLPPHSLANLISDARLHTYIIDVFVNVVDLLGHG